MTTKTKMTEGRTAAPGRPPLILGAVLVTEVAVALGAAEEVVADWAGRLGVVVGVDWRGRPALAEADAARLFDEVSRRWAYEGRAWQALVAENDRRRREAAARRDAEVAAIRAQEAERVAAARSRAQQVAAERLGMELEADSQARFVAAGEPLEDFEAWKKRYEEGSV